MRWVIVVLVAVLAGYMLVDGLRALMVGDYLTPSSGEYAGQLGPWAGVVERVGVEPRSIAMKSVFVVYGVVGLGLDLAFLVGRPWAWWGIGAFAIASLWYLVPGTVISALVVAFLALPGIRSDYVG